MVQIDHQLKPVDKSGKKSKKSKKSKKKSQESKKIYKHVSITAYYKRTSLSIINIQKLAYDIQLEARQIPFTQQQQQRQGLVSQVSLPHGQNIQHPAWCHGESATYNSRIIRVRGLGNHCTQSLLRSIGSVVDPIRERPKLSDINACYKRNGVAPRPALMLIVYSLARKFYLIYTL